MFTGVSLVCGDSALLLKRKKEKKRETVKNSSSQQTNTLSQLIELEGKKEKCSFS